MDKDYGSSGRRARWSRLAGLVLMVWTALAAATGWAQPANDNFASATVITGTTGTTTGSNVNATAEPGEPVHAGVGGGKSIWYKWTASFTGTISFNTEGSSFDTVLAVYTGGSVSTLTQVAANDDSDFPIDLTSAVSFPVTTGATYYVAVDGFLGDSGVVVLNWLPTGAFSSGNFFVAVATVPTIPTAGVPFHPATQPVYDISDFDAGGSAAQVRVSRVTGASGRVLVNYVVTNLFFTNTVTTNVFGTNTLTTVYDTNMNQLGFTNIFITNYFITETLGSFTTNGTFTTCTYTSGNQLTNGLQIGYTNANGLIGTGRTNVVSGPPALCGFLTLTNTVTNNGQIVITISNIFCTNYTGNGLVPSAVPGLDYEPAGGTLEFADYEMAKWIPLDILGDTATDLNRLVVVKLTSAALDPNESPTLAAPTIDAMGGTAKVVLMNVNLANGDTCRAGFADPTNIINFASGVLITIPGDASYGVTETVERINPNGQSQVNYTVGYNPARITPNFTPDYLLQPGSDYANPNPPNTQIPSTQPPDYNAATGTLNFPQGSGSQPLSFSTIFNNTIKFNEDFQITLTLPQGGGNATLGNVNAQTVTILFQNQPPGAVDRDYNVDDDNVTSPPYNLWPGANNLVYALAVQPDSKTILAGDFTSYNTFPRYRLARANSDGSIDPAFAAAPNSGADNTITSLALQNNGSIIIGGNFTSYNGVDRHGIARVDSNAGLDPSFNPGVGVNGLVDAVALQPADGKVLVAGNFSSVNGTNRNSIARLNADGSLDTTFDPGVGPNDTIHSIALQLDGKIVIGGDFTSYSGANTPYVARLNVDGSLDTSFNPGKGPDAGVLAVVVQNDQRVLIAGAFQNVNLLNRSCIARLNADGSLDFNFNPGTGADGNILAMTLQQDGKILIGGLFKNYNQTRRVGIARLLSYGSLDTTFMDTAFNQFAGVIKDYFNDDYQPRNFIQAIGVQQDGDIMVGGYFDHLGGETNRDIGGFSRDGTGPRRNIARMVGNFPVQLSPGLIVPPAPGNIGLAYDTYTADKSVYFTYVTLYRTNGGLGPASVTFTPIPGQAGPGVAQANLDFVPQALNPVWTTINSTEWEFADCWLGPNFEVTDSLAPTAPLRYVGIGFAPVYVDILNNTNSTGDLSLGLGISQPQSSDIFMLGNENIPIGVALDSRVNAQMTIVDDSLHHGFLGFSTNAYTVVESGTNAIITVTRTSGGTGPVSINYATVTGGTAVPGSTNDYISVSGTLNFTDGQTSRTFAVPLVNNNISHPDRTVNLNLSHVTGGASTSITNAVLTIIDDNFKPGHVNFSSASYSAHETAGTATITVNRNGGSLNTLSVTYLTANGTATNGQNYAAVSNTLFWNSGDVTPRSFTVPLIHDSLVTSNLTVNLILTNAQVNGTTTSFALGLVSNAILTVVNDDFYGRPTFSTSSYTVNENGAYATITVNRLGGNAQTISVGYSTSDGTAFAGQDYGAVSGTLIFNPGEVSKAFTVPITNFPVPMGNRFFQVALSNPQPSSGPGGAVQLGSPSNAVVTIVDPLTFNEPPGGLDTLYNGSAGFNDSVYALALQSDGRIIAGGDFTSASGTPRNRIARLNTDGSIDAKFSSPTAGVNASIRSMLIQSDGRVLLGGLFTTVNGVNRHYFGRMNFDGGLDETFNPGAGADNPVFALGETFVGPTSVASNRRVLLGGSFASINGTTRNGIAQLNNDGSVDTSFAPSGANGTVYALAVYSTNDTVNGGKIIIGGDFTQVNGVTRNHIARLNADGSLDTTFNPGVGANDSVRAVAIQVDGKVIIGGLFTSVGSSPLNHIARLNPNGTVDGLFNPGLGANDLVDAITIQEDHRILIGGAFTQANGVTRNRLSRLNEDGSVDAGINFGSGADSFVSAILVQTDDEIVIAGGFQNFAGQPREHLARIYGRYDNGPGTIQFSAADFPVIDNISTNVLITVQRVGGTVGQATAVFETFDGTAISGSNYIGTTNLLVFPNGETFQSVNIPILPNNIVDQNRQVNLLLTNFTGAAQGAQPSATITIINDNAGISFASPTYTVIKNAVNGAALISLVRSGAAIGQSSIDFATTTSGTATNGTDYTPVSQTVVFPNGVTNEMVTVPVINNGLLEGNRTVGMVLSNPTNALLLSPNAATLTIVDNNLPPGNFTFSSVGYSVLETAGSALITVVRTNGSIGQVQVTCTVAGGTAISNLNYIPVVTNLAFGDGVTSKSFTVPILHNPAVTGNVTVNLTLSNPTGGTQITGLNPTPLTIVEADTGLSFDHAAYFANDTNGTVTVGVQRVGGSTGAVSVNYSTTNGTALANTDYLATSGTLNFASGETFKTFNVAILRDSAITGNRILLVNLSNPVGGAQLISPSSSAITIFDTDTGLSFASASNSIAKSAPFVVVPVLRTGSTAGAVSVNYATTDGSAVASTNYFPTNGVLTFADGQTSSSFIVQLINDNLVDPNLTFTNLLFNPSGTAQLLIPSNQTVTLVNDEAGFTFSSANYSVVKSGVSATITVLRTGYTNSAVSVNYATSDGTAHAPTKYLPAAGTLIFAPGQVSATFTVTVIDNKLIEGNQTVNVTLSTPSVGAILLNPNSATLTIIDDNGSLILPAGAALTSESGPVDGAIEPGETVTLLFALRNAVGTNTGNLVATLVASNGVTAPSGAQTYGVLVTNGASVSRSFTFTASGTNGALIGATFLLQDGALNLGVATFNFTLGRVTNTFASPAPITINDNAPASPYPATINVSGVIGTVNHLTATLSSLTHGNLSDVSALLVGPTGTNTLLMSKIGGNNPVSGVTLTFDDLASAQLTANPPATGSYKPTQFSSIVPFPATSNGVGQLPKPFGTNMSGFVNSNPNGTWKLYVLDDTPLDLGAINGGWSVTISTLSVVPPTVDLVAGLSASPAVSIVSSNITYTVTVSNSGPSAATGVSVTDALPPGVTIVSASGWIATNGNLVWNVGPLALGASATSSFVVTAPSVPTVLTNVISAAANETDANPADNVASTVTTVGSPLADLAIGLSGAPDPVGVGGTLTYTVVITNLGPATASPVVVTDALPAGITFVSANTTGTVTNVSGTVYVTFAGLGSGMTNAFTIVTTANVSGTATNTVVVGSPIPDPLKGNNRASVKTVVQGGPQLALARSANNFVFTWPAGSGWGLQMATNLTPPVTWTSVTNPAPSLIGGQNSVTLPVTNGRMFIRLVSPWP